MTDNARAIVLMIASMAGFTGVDVFAKLARETQSAGQVLALTSGLMFVIFYVAMWRNGERLSHPLAWNRTLLVRSMGEVVGSVGIIIALGLVPLSTVVVLGQALPLAATLGAVVFLGEKVGWRRWAAVGAGFFGVLLILRPGLEGFDPNALWVVLYIVGLAARDLASRGLPRTISTQFAVTWSMLYLTIAGVVLVWFEGGWQPIDGPAAAYLLAITLSASVGVTLITMAMRLGEVSAVAPFRYSRLIFALGFAFLVFGEVPDAATWAGSALIVGSGLYAFWRERQGAARAKDA